MRVCYPVWAVLLLLLVACGRSPERTAADQVSGLLRMNRPYNALEVAGRFLATHPNSDAIKRLRIIALLKAGREEDAYADFQKLPRGSTVLEDALGSPDSSFRGVVARFIANYRIGTVERKYLLHGLSDADPEVRANSVRALGRLYANESIRPLYECLQDDYWLVRAEAAKALGHVQDERVVGWLTGLVGDSDGYVRFCAMEALMAQPRTATLSILTETLPRVKLPRKLYVAVALTRLGHTNGIPVITGALQSSPMQNWTIEVVRDLPVPIAKDLLHDLLSSTNRVVRQHASNVWERVLSPAPQPVFNTAFSIAPL